MGRVQKWYTANGLLINPSKTEFMVLGKDNLLEVTVKEGENDINIKSKKHLKVLGITIDQKLSWERHVSQIKSRTSNAIRNIRRTADVLPLKSRVLLNEALVTPHYNYCDIIYDGCSKKAKANLQRNQNYAAKALLGRNKTSSATTALKDLKWLPLETRRKLHTGVFIHKAINGNSSQHGTQAVQALRPRHNHNTRQVENRTLYNRAHSTKLYEKSLTYRAAKVWNSIPTSIKNLDTAAKMKNAWQGSLINSFLTTH